MFMLKKLTDPALKRLYKFVLKRLIGVFLLEELDLDQLDVHLRAGNLSLKNLAINTDMINQTFLADSPFRLASGYLGSVKVSISYANILSENCVVEVDDVELVVVPINCPGVAEEREQEAVKNQNQKPVDEDDEKRRNNDEELEDENDYGSREGLDFVASWIEQISSKIKVSLSNVSLRFDGDPSSHSSKLVCHLQYAEFCDETPLCNDNSSNAEQQQKANSVANNIGISHKGINFSGFSVKLLTPLEDNFDGIEENYHSTVILQNEAKCYAQLKFSHYDMNTDAPEMDVDVFFHAIRVQLQPHNLSPISSILDSFGTSDQNISRSTHSSMMMYQSICDSNPQWMKPNSNEKNSSLALSRTEFQRIEHILHQHSVNMILPIRSRVISAADSIESTGLSDLDEEENELFFDCKSSVLHQSIYQDSTAQPSQLFIGRNAVKLRMKVHVLKCELVFLYENVDQLTCSHANSMFACDHCERFVFSCKDLMTLFLMYPSQSTLSLTIQSLIGFELIEPKFSQANGNDEELQQEEKLIEVTVFSFQEKKNISPPNVNLNLQMDYDDNVTSINARMTSGNLVVEWDMMLLQRLQNYLILLEEENKEEKFAETLDCNKKCSFEYVTKQLEFHLRFPMIVSDLVRFGPSCIRGCCEDCLVLCVDNVELKCFSYNDEDSITVDWTRVNWFNQFLVEFSQLTVDLKVPVDLNQRHEQRITYRLLETHGNFNRNKILFALEPSASQNEDFFGPAFDIFHQEHQEDILNQMYKNQNAIKRNSQYTLDINLTNSTTIHLTNASLTRLLVLFDGLLLLNPENDSTLPSTTQRNYMTLYLKSDGGVFHLNESDNVLDIFFKDWEIWQVSQWLGELNHNQLLFNVKEIALFEGDKLPVFSSIQPNNLMMVMKTQEKEDHIREVDFKLLGQQVVLHYRFESDWLMKMMTVFSIDYPVYVLPFDSPYQDYFPVNGKEIVHLPMPTVTVFTKLNVILLDIRADYIPTPFIQEGMTPQLPDVRALFVCRYFTLQSNLVSGALDHGYRMRWSGVNAYLTRPIFYGEKDLYFSEQKQLVDRYYHDETAISTVYTLEQYVEKHSFLAVCSLDEADLFFTTEMKSEVNFGLLQSYLCYDSLATILTLIDYMSTHYAFLAKQEAQANFQAKVEINEDFAKQESTASLNIFEQIELDAFKHVSQKKEEERSLIKAKNSCTSPRLARLVIEDYYTLDSTSTSSFNSMSSSCQNNGSIVNPINPWFQSNICQEDVVEEEEEDLEQSAKWLKQENVEHDLLPSCFEAIEVDDEENLSCLDVEEEFNEHQDTGSTMSMSLIGTEEDEGTEVELNLELGNKLYGELSKILDISEEDNEIEEGDEKEKQQEESPWNRDEISPTGQQSARWFSNVNEEEEDPKLRIYPHHVEIPLSGKAACFNFGEKETLFARRSASSAKNTDAKEEKSPCLAHHISVREGNLRIRLFGGRDWVNNKNKKTSTQQALNPSIPEKPTRKTDLLNALLDNYVDQASSSTALFPTKDNNTITTTIHTSNNSSSGRKTEQMMEFVLTQLQVRADLYDGEHPLSSSIVVSINDVEVLDYISTSQIRKMACYWKSDQNHPRESGTGLIHLHLMSVFPGDKGLLDKNRQEEYRLKLKILPLRLNLDQETIDFLRNFADNLASISSCENDKAVGEGETEAIFFQSCDIKACKIKIDYRPQRVDYAALRGGDYLEMLNLFILEDMSLNLSHIKLNGISGGWIVLANQVLMAWVQNITQHQVHKCVAGVAMPMPMRSLANLGSGVADLILLPMAQYQRERKIGLKGVKQGAASFVKTVSIETLNTASKIARGTQTLLEHADDVVSSSKSKKMNHAHTFMKRKRMMQSHLSGGASSFTGRRGNRHARYLATQPADAREGFSQAYDSISRELQTAAKTIIAVPLIEYQKTGPQGYVKSVIRAVPVAVLRPLIGTTEALNRALIGVRNAVDPEVKQDMENKFKCSF